MGWGNSPSAMIAEFCIDAGNVAGGEGGKSGGGEYQGDGVECLVKITMNTDVNMVHPVMIGFCARLGRIGMDERM